MIGAAASMFRTLMRGLAGALLIGGAATGAAQTPAFVGTDQCLTCHAEIGEAWSTSHHALAWTEPSEETVLGDFSDATFTHAGRTSRFLREGGDFIIETDDIAGEPRRFTVAGVAGVAPLQQYLVETEPGRLQSFDVVWDVEKKRWYHLYPDLPLPPDDGLHWSGPYKNWNSRCAECHATGFDKAYSPRTRTYQSRQVEIGVGCEACHGPGEAHIAWANDPDAPLPDETGEHGFLIDFEGAEAEIQQCAACHSRRGPLQSEMPLAGTPYHDAYSLARLRDGLYHADGQILDEVYVYGSFLQSKMYAEGVRCSDCHEVHAAVVKFDDNAVCTQCHSPAGNTRFPELPLKLYDDPAHHFHEPGTDGAACVSCHMIERTYMGIDGRRDHSFRVPRPDLTVSIGTPNACNDCHTDETAQWAAAAIRDWYPDSRHRGLHYGQVFSQARRSGDGYGEELLAFARQRSLPGIVRATALDLLASRTDRDFSAEAAELIEDDDPTVRTAAIDLQARAPASERLERILPALSDPVKAVRIAAARQLIGLPVGSLTEAQRADAAAAAANQDWQASLVATFDFPETQMILGGTALALRDARTAVSAFREAVTLDPQLADAWIMLVRVQMAVGDVAGAADSLQAALAANPDNQALTALRRDYEAATGNRLD